MTVPNSPSAAIPAPESAAVPGSAPNSASAPAPDAPPVTVAVLGGTGFVGKAVSKALIERGHPVVAVARTARPVADGAVFAALDLAAARPADLAALLREHSVGAVVNAAGGMWGLTEAQMVDANVTLVAHLLEAVAALPGRVRVVQLGSVHEYGLAPLGTSMTETYVPEPVMPYGKLKLECSNLVLDAAARGEADAVVLRVGNVVGAGQPGHSLLGVVADRLLAARAAGHADLTLGALVSLRDFLPLSDAAEAVAAAVTAPAAGGEVVNIGTGHAHNARQLVTMLIEASGVPTTLTESEAPGPETDWQQMGIAKAADLLGWTPRRTLADAIAELWTAAVAADPGR
ncbi:NAD-dependent epimerase/dehydratase family protein [Catenulispora yoronensis]|uniref:NAD-dependent epimerase/dehydratase family protein n=1 Tax=Catenulispora yoronensis TaxID=450799 RepID=A0ABN2TKT8_9ACTN